MLSTETENGALLATLSAAIQPQHAMADDCRDRLAALQTDFDGVFYDRPSACHLRAADLIWVSIERAEMELEQIESDACAVLSTIADSGATHSPRAPSSCKPTRPNSSAAWVS